MATLGIYTLLTEHIDITDRFDTTFIFGDLNFRLDITRLHADWLISRKGSLTFRLCYPHS